MSEFGLFYLVEAIEELSDDSSCFSSVIGPNKVLFDEEIAYKDVEFV